MPLNIAKATVKIGGSPVSDEFMDDLAEIVVNTDLHLPSMFTLRLQDHKYKWVDDSLLDLGKEVEISIDPSDLGNTTGTTGVLIKGEITALEPEYGPQEGVLRLTVRGYDKGHRLHRGKKSRTFLNMKDSDVVAKIAGEAGLTADADATSVTFPYILQNNQTNMEFLQERARRIGYWVYVDGVGGKLCFKKATADRGSGPELTWGETLYSFSPRLSGVHQADKVKVFGWDSKAKKAILSEVAPVAPSNQGGITKGGGAAAKTAFGGSAEAVVVSEPVITVDDAKAMAEGLGEQISRNYLWAEGRCFGDTKVQAGMVVTIKNVGTRFNGKYLVTAATHIYDGREYWTEFSITGQDPYTFNALLGVEPPASAQVPGVVTGVVTNLKDPDDLGRVKIKYPWMGKDSQGVEVESDWVRLSTPMAGAQRGLMILPEVNDEVLVAFDHGNLDFPYVVGGLWGSTDKPPLTNAVAGKDGKVVQRVLKTRAGHIITIDDSDDKPLISVVDKTTKNSVVIDSKANTITVKSDSTITLEAANGDVVIKGKNVSIESMQNTTVKAKQNVTVEATSQLGMKGTAGAKLESPAQVEVSSSGQATFKGSITKIN